MIARARSSLLSPSVAFPVVWTLGVLLAQIHLLDSQQNWSSKVWLVMLIVPATFVAGCTGGKWLAARALRTGYRFPVPRLTIGIMPVLLVCTGVGMLELAHQFIAAGEVPLLSGNIDAARFELPGGPTIILTNLLAIAAIVSLVVPSSLRGRDARPYLAIVLVCLGGYALQGGRGSLVLPIVVGVIARAMFWGWPRSSPWSLLLLSGVLIVAISGLFFARTSEETDPFQAELYAHVLPGLPPLLYPLVPVDLAISTNFQTLANVVEYFPDSEPYGRGAFSEWGLDLIFPSARHLSDTTSRINPPWTTATVAGSLWADGGFVIVIFGVLLTGVLSNLAFWLFRGTRELRFALVAAYLLYLALFGVYTNLWTQQPDWLFITPLLLVLGTLVQRDMPLAAAPGALSPPPPQDPHTFSPRGAAGVRRSRGAAVLVAILALVLFGAVLGATLPPGGVPAPVAGTLSARYGAPLGRAATDADATGPDSLVYRLERLRGPGVILQIDSARDPSMDSVERIASGGRADLGYDVTNWSPNGPPSLFEFSARADGSVGYSIIGTETGLLIDSGGFDLPMASGGAKRELFVARWGGNRPDLLIVDRGGTGPARVTVRSGESGFGRTVARFTIVSPNLDPGIWSVDVGNADPPEDPSERPDLVMFLRTDKLRRAEVHVLSGESGFQSFTQHRVLAIQASEARTKTFLSGRLDGSPFALAFDPPDQARREIVRAASIFANSP